MLTTVVVRKEILGISRLRLALCRNLHMAEDAVYSFSVILHRSSDKLHEHACLSDPVPLSLQHLITCLNVMQDLSKKKIPAEQLAYAAALASGAQLVYGDIPKLETIRNLWHQATVQELDVHFSRQAAANFRSLLEGGQCILPDTPASNRAFQALFSDREAAFCRTLKDCSRQLDPWHAPDGAAAASELSSGTSGMSEAGLQPAKVSQDSKQETGSVADHGNRPADAAASGKQQANRQPIQKGAVGSVVGIVGEDHLEGIQRAWHAGLRYSDSKIRTGGQPPASTWSAAKNASGQAEQAESSPEARQLTGIVSQHLGVQGASDAGVKRALLERMLGLAIPEQLALDLCQQVA